MYVYSAEYPWWKEGEKESGEGSMERTGLKLLFQDDSALCLSCSSDMWVTVQVCHQTQQKTYLKGISVVGTVAIWSKSTLIKAVPISKVQLA